MSNLAQFLVSQEPDIQKKLTKEEIKAPNVKLEVTQQAQSFFRCKLHKSVKIINSIQIDQSNQGCHFCKTQILEGERFKVKTSRQLKYYKQSDSEPIFTFKDLVSNLVSNPQNPNDLLIKGCQIFIPETVFFKEDGKLDFITTTDRDCCVAIDTKVKMNHTSVRTKFCEVLRERKKDAEIYGRQKTVQNLKKKVSGNFLFIDFCRFEIT